MENFCLKWDDSEQQKGATGVKAKADQDWDKKLVIKTPLEIWTTDLTSSVISYSTCSTVFISWVDGQRV